MLTVISFFTQDWRYPFYAELLRRDCINLQIAHQIEQLPSTGSYLRNTCLKPKFILDKLLYLRSPVLWIDCDGSLINRPVFFEDLDADFAAKRMAFYRKRTWHVGTMWFNYNPAVIAFIKEWISNTGLISDESGLEKTWRNSKISAVDIPEEYFRILKPNEQPKKTDVICHRISDGESKRVELPIAIKRAKRGVL